MDMEGESKGKTSAAPITVAEMDPMVMMERFSQMQNAVQQMQETMQHLQQDVASFRQQNTRLTSQLHTTRVSNKRVRNRSPPTPNSDTQACQFPCPVVVKVEQNNKRGRSISPPTPNSDTQACQFPCPVVVKVEQNNKRARSISPPTPNSETQACQFPCPVVVKVEQDDLSENTQVAVNKTEPCADSEPYGTSAGHSYHRESEQSVKQESNIRCQVEGEDRAWMTWENSEQGMESMTIIARPPSAQHTAQTAPDCSCPDSMKMPVKTFVVVEFTREGTVDIIHARWLKNTAFDNGILTGEAYWPPCGEAVDKCVRAGTQPSHSWTKHPVRIMTSTDDYLSARKKAQYTSSLESGDEDCPSQRPARKRKALQLQYSTDEEEEAASCSIFSKVPKSVRQLTPAKAPMLPVTPRVPSLSIGAVQDLDDPDEIQRIFSPSNCSPGTGSSRHQVNEVLESQVQKELVELKALVLQLRNDQRQMNSMMALMFNKKEECHAELPSDLELPLKTVADVEALEARLDIVTQENLVKSLSAIGGKEVKELVKRVMRQLLTDNCARNYNWKGKNDKLPFSNLKLHTLVTRAVKRNPGTSQASAGDVEARVKEWLRFASERDGGRKEREERKRRQWNNSSAES